MTGGSQMERLSHEAGWTPDARNGYCIAHSFQGDHVTSRRDVIIAHPPNHPFATFSCACRARFAAQTMTPPQLAFFLSRNSESVFGKWQIALENDLVTADLRYTALVGGLDAEHYRLICMGLVSEVAIVEATLRSQGML